VNWAELTAQELIWECAKTRNSAAWAEFINRYHPVILSAANTVARRWHQVHLGESDDLTQEIYLKLCANGARGLSALREVQTEAIPSYLKVIAINAAHDYLRAKATQRRGGLITEQISAHHDILSAGGENLERRLTLQKIDQVLETETHLEKGERDRMVFRLHYRQGMTAKEIAALPSIQLTTKGVEAVIYRLTNRISEQFAVQQGNPRGSRLNEVGGG
jgi:RNA polymerase sigma factor (sigma-70 family)